MLPTFKSSLLLLILLSLFSFFYANAQVNINSSSSAFLLAQKLAGAGVIITNPQLNCPNKASGVFTTITGGVGLDSGIILSTGYAATQGSINGLNGGSGVLASYNFSAPGDVSLNTLAGQNTFDACALEFDFIPNGDSVHFNYVFSSEEYINATCGPYNDAFAFFISGPGISGQKNMALVPNTNIPVTINSINSGIPGPGQNLSNCTSMGPGSPFTAYFVDNTNGPYITHKGFTTILEAKNAVTPCSTYHLKMVIADAGNHLYDSGVFIQAGSLQSGNASLQLNSGINNKGEKFIVKGCLPATILVNRSSVANTLQAYQLEYSGTVVQNLDVNLLPDSIVFPPNNTAVQFSILGLLTPKNGKRTLTIKLLSSFTCGGVHVVLDSVSLVVYDSLSTKILTPDTSICFEDSIMIRVEADSFLQFSWWPNTDISNILAMQPIVYPAQPITYFLKGFFPNSGCTSLKDSIHFSASPLPSIKLNDVVACGHVPLQFIPQITPPYPGYHFLWVGPNGFSSTVSQPTILDPTHVNEGIYSLQVRADTSTCMATSSFHLQIINPGLPDVKSPFQFCEEEGKEYQLEATGINLIWYDENKNNPTSIAPIITSTNSANYLFYLSQIINGCESEKVPVVVEVKKCCEAEIAIPSAFTPNYDSKNDSWKVIPGFGYDVIEIRIFNRWGQQVFYSVNDEPWDGTFLGEVMEMGSYAYEIQVKCILTEIITKKKGFLTLIK